jgi:hypothetical protein
LLAGVDDGFGTAGRLKRATAAAEKKLKQDRKTYVGDLARVARLRAEAEAAERLLSGANRKWLCNRYGTLHDMPSQCSDPDSGGVWVVVDADGRTRRWAEPTQAQRAAAARARRALDLLGAKLAEAKARLYAAERALRDDLTRYNRLVDQVTAKSAKLTDPRRVLDDVARAAARRGDEATARQVNGLARLLGKVSGNGECVALVKAYAGLGATGTWKEGDAVGKGAPVAPFAPIATFVDGSYPNKPRGNHAAILLERTRDGLLVFDQYAGKRGGMHVIPFKGGTAANQALIDRGEAEAAGQGLTEADGKAYYRVKYKYYSPSNDADNYSYVRRGSSP